MIVRSRPRRLQQLRLRSVDSPLTTQKQGSSLWKTAFYQGYRRAATSTLRQKIIRGSVDGFLLATLLLGFGSFWVRLVLCLVVRMVYGAIASSDRYAGRL